MLEKYLRDILFLNIIIKNQDHLDLKILKKMISVFETYPDSVVGILLKKFNFSQINNLMEFIENFLLFCKNKSKEDSKDLERLLTVLEKFSFEQILEFLKLNDIYIPLAIVDIRAFHLIINLPYEHISFFIKKNFIFKFKLNDFTEIYENYKKTNRII